MLGGSSSKSSFSATPVNLQSPYYNNLQAPTTGGLDAFFQPNAAGASGNTGSSFGLSPFSANGVPTNSASNPLVAGLDPNSLALIGQAYGLGSGNPLLSGASGYLNGVMNPNYPSSLATSPQTMSAVNAAVNPLISAFNQTTLPGLKGQFTAAGQRIGNAVSSPGTAGAAPLQKGSSAFDQSQNQAQNNLLQQVGSTAAGIENQAYQTGLGQQTQAVNQAQAISSTEVNNLVQSLQATAMPQMIQQYGINAGTQLFQSQMENILKALGVSATASQPVIGYNQQGSGTSQSSPGILPSLGTQALGYGLGNFIFG